MQCALLDLLLCYTLVTNYVFTDMCIPSASVVFLLRRICFPLANCVFAPCFSCSFLASLIDFHLLFQSYACVFEATVSDMSGFGSARASGRSLTVEMNGEGVLPRVAIVKPVLRQVPISQRISKDPQPLLLFPRLLLGQTCKMPVTLKNSSDYLPCTVFITLVQPEGGDVFKMACGDGGQQRLLHMDENALLEERMKLQAKSAPEEDTSNFSRQQLMIKLSPAEAATFQVSFEANNIGLCQTSFLVTVEDNQFERLYVLASGEGYEDDFSIENLPYYHAEHSARKDNRKGKPPSPTSGNMQCTRLIHTCTVQW